MAEKMTKKDWYAAIRKVVAESDIANAEGALAFIDHEVELLGRKSASNKMTKTQKENVGVKALIHDALFEIAKPVTITELMANSAELKQYSPQKVSALLSQMKKSGEVIRTEDKKKAYFSLPDAADAE